MHPQCACPNLCGIITYFPHPASWLHAYPVRMSRITQNDNTISEFPLPAMHVPSTHIFFAFPPPLLCAYRVRVCQFMSDNQTLLPFQIPRNNHNICSSPPCRVRTRYACPGSVEKLHFSFAFPFHASCVPGTHVPSRIE